MKPSRIQKAVIYCRASDAEAQRRTENLLLQELACRTHASRQGYDVVEVFRDVGSVKDAERPALSNLLNYLTTHQGQGLAVVIDDASRLARGMGAYFDVRSAILGSGATLEIPAHHLPMVG